MTFDVKRWREVNRTRLIQWNRDRRREKGARERRLITPDLIARVQELRSQGVGPPDIAREIGMSIPTVYRCIGGIRNALPPLKLSERLPLYDGCKPVEGDGGRYMTCRYYDTALQHAMKREWSSFTCPAECPEFTTEPEAQEGAQMRKEEKEAPTEPPSSIKDAQRRFSEVEYSAFTVRSMLASVTALDAVDAFDPLFKSRMLAVANEMATRNQEQLEALSEALGALAGGA